MATIVNMLGSSHQKVIFATPNYRRWEGVFQTNFRRKRQCGLVQKKSHLVNQGLICTERNWCCVYGENLVDSKSRLNAALYTVSNSIGLQKQYVWNQDHPPTRQRQTSYRKIDQEKTPGAGLGSEYSIDIASSDYHLFRDLAANLDEKYFDKDEDVENYLQEYFDSNPKIFYERGIAY